MVLFFRLSSIRDPGLLGTLGIRTCSWQDKTPPFRSVETICVVYQIFWIFYTHSVNQTPVIFVIWLLCLFNIFYIFWCFVYFNLFLFHCKLFLICYISKAQEITIKVLILKTDIFVLGIKLPQCTRSLYR